jgi:heme A synthase
MVFLQLMIGGLLTFNFISAGIHIVMGIIVFLLAIVTMIATMVVKPRIKSLLITAIVLVLLVILQIVLGFDALKTGSQSVAWIHFANAMAIYGVAFSGTFVASRSAKPNKPEL